MSVLIKHPWNNFMFLSVYIVVDWNEPMILSLCILFYSFVFTFCIFVTLGFSSISSLLLVMFACLLTFSPWSMATAITICKGKYYVIYYCSIPSLCKYYVIYYCSIPSLSGLWLMCSDLALILQLLLFCLLYVTLVLAVSYLLSLSCLASIISLPPPIPMSYWFSILLSCLSLCMCSFMGMLYMG